MAHYSDMGLDDPLSLHGSQGSSGIPQFVENTGNFTTWNLSESTSSGSGQWRKGVPVQASYTMQPGNQPVQQAYAEMMPATHGYTMQAVEALPVSPRTSATPVRPYAFRAPNLVQVQAMSLQQVVPMTQAYTFGYAEPMPPPPPPVQAVHAVSTEYIPPQSNFKEVMTVEAVPYPQYDQSLYHQERAYTPSLSTNSPPPSPMMTRNQNKLQRSAPPPRVPGSMQSEEEEEEEEEQEDLPVFNKQKNRAQRSVQRAPMPQPEVQPEIIFVDQEEPKFRVVQVENEVLAPRRERVEAETISLNERVLDVEKVHITEELVDVEKIVVKEVQVPFDVFVDNVVVKEVIQEVEIERPVVKEVEKPIEKLVIKEVPVPVERIVENIITQEVPVERIVVKEVPVPIERIVVKDVQVPVERIVERIIEKPVERIVNQERIVHQERIVYQDRVIEVPVERRVEVVPTTFEAPPIQVQKVEYSDAALQLPQQQQAPSYHVFKQAEPLSQVSTLSNTIGVDRHQHVQQRAQSDQFSSLVSVPGSDMYRESVLPSSGRKKIGLGVLLKRSTASQGMTYVEEIIPGFAAANSDGKIRVGDLVLSIDSTAVQGWDIDNIKQLTIGDEGTTCSLTCQRGESVFDVTMIRVSPPVIGREGQKAIESYGLPRE